MMSQYIYLLQEREFIKTKEHIYKVGMTKKENHERFNQYPKGSVLLFQIICNNCKNMEKLVLKKFKETFKQRKDIGNEYFEGEYKNMIDIIYSTIKDENEIGIGEDDDEDIVEENAEENVVEDWKMVVKSKKYQENAFKNVCNNIFPDHIMIEIPAVETPITTVENQIESFENTTPLFVCKYCTYRTNTKYDFKKHLTTKKHNLLSNNTTTTKFHTCSCGKSFLNRQGLCNHKTKTNCIKTNPYTNKNDNKK